MTGITERNLNRFECSSFPQNYRLSSMASRVIQDGDLYVCMFNKNFIRLESYFQIEILVKICSPHELLLIDKKRLSF